MHIPEGYLGPQTYLAGYAAMVPAWAVASRYLNKRLRARQVPLLAQGAAFSFVIMMFTVPIPGGTTGHAVGAVLVAVLLGPWAACVAVSVALVVQALVFGDGGVTAIGANCFNMALVMPFTGYAVYRVIAGQSDARSRRRWIGAGLGGYVGLNLAALCTGIEFGLQPLMAHDAAGTPLYAPYPLQVAVPAMAVTHLALFGFVEAVATALVVAYLQRAEPSLITGAEQAG
jgi:cobalt/nickel transport system permease protein